VVYNDSFVGRLQRPIAVASGAMTAYHLPRVYPLQRMFYRPLAPAIGQHPGATLLGLFPPGEVRAGEDLPSTAVLPQGDVTVTAGAVPERTEVAASIPPQPSSGVLTWQQTGRDLAPSATLRSIPANQEQETMLFWSGSLLGAGFAFLVAAAELAPSVRRRRRAGGAATGT